MNLNLRENYPAPLINEYPELTKLAQGAAVKMLGESALALLEKMMGAEDFSGLTQKTPGVYGFIGARNIAKCINSTHHNPAFEIDEDVLHKGAGFTRNLPWIILTRNNMYLQVPPWPGSANAGPFHNSALWKIII